MGGQGSGNRWRSGTKRTVDGSKRIDIRYMNKHGMLKSGHFDWFWTRNGERMGDVGISVVAGISITVTYRWNSSSNEEWKSMKQTVLLAHTSCALGGSRPWFICPYCQRRVAVIIVDGPHVACRHCLNLTYTVCNEDHIHRSWRRADKYKSKLGGEDVYLYMKPKGMHWKTWKRLRQQYFNADGQGWQLVAAKTA